MDMEMDLSLAILKSKLWALEILDSLNLGHVSLSIDVSDIDKTTILLLAPVHQSFKTSTLHNVYWWSHIRIRDHWWSEYKDDQLIFECIPNVETEREICQPFELGIYQHEHHIYAFIQNSNDNTLVVESCLIFYDLKDLTKADVGYSGGRFGVGTRML